jgi:hypothetical protein
MTGALRFQQSLALAVAMTLLALAKPAQATDEIQVYNAASRRLDSLRSSST